MSDLFISRPYGERDAGGRWSLTWVNPAPRDAAAWRVVGPCPVELPCGPLDDAELSRWIDDFQRRGFTWGLAVGESGLAVEEVAAELTAEARRQVVLFTAMEWQRRLGVGEPLLAVVLTNAGPVPVPGLRVSWHGAGQTFEVRPEFPFGGVLAPGEAAAFVLAGEQLGWSRSHAAALSPEDYYISVRSGEWELARVPGRVAGELVEHEPP